MSHFKPEQLAEMQQVITAVVNGALETFAAHRAAIDVTFQELQKTRTEADEKFKEMNTKAESFSVSVGTAVTELATQQQRIALQMNDQQADIIEQFKEQAKNQQVDFESLHALEVKIQAWTS